MRKRTAFSILPRTLASWKCIDLSDESDVDLEVHPKRLAQGNSQEAPQCDTSSVRSHDENSPPGGISDCKLTQRSADSVPARLPHLEVSESPTCAKRKLPRARPCSVTKRGSVLVDLTADDECVGTNIEVFDSPQAKRSKPRVKHTPWQRRDKRHLDFTECSAACEKVASAKTTKHAIVGSKCALLRKEMAMLQRQSRENEKILRGEKEAAVRDEKARTARVIADKNRALEAEKERSAQLETLLKNRELRPVECSSAPTVAKQDFAVSSTAPVRIDKQAPSKQPKGQAEDKMLVCETDLARFESGWDEGLCGAERRQLQESIARAVENGSLREVKKRVEYLLGRSVQGDISLGDIPAGKQRPLLAFMREVATRPVSRHLSRRHRKADVRLNITADHPSRIQQDSGVVDEPKLPARARDERSMDPTLLMAPLDGDFDITSPAAVDRFLEIFDPVEAFE